uniref:SFRICE_003763 n=1 Tax=Spodoptera frugiperda TaxID=7108 RepID=A0A2H1VHT1_SPOFR
MLSEITSKEEFRSSRRRRISSRNESRRIDFSITSTALSGGSLSRGLVEVTLSPSTMMMLQSRLQNRCRFTMVLMITAFFNIGFFARIVRIVRIVRIPYDVISTHRIVEHKIEICSADADLHSLHKIADNCAQGHSVASPSRRLHCVVTNRKIKPVLCSITFGKEEANAFNMMLRHPAIVKVDGVFFILREYTSSTAYKWQLTKGLFSHGQALSINHHACS